MSKERELLKEAVSWMVDLSDIYADERSSDDRIKLMLKDQINSIEALLAKPEQEPAWIETNGKEPYDWEDYEYIWTLWKSGRISLDEAYGCWTWEDITHWMPAFITEPLKPR